VGVDLGAPHFDRDLVELGLLAETAGMQPVARLTCKRPAPDAALFVGSGKADEIRLLAAAEGAQEVLFDQASRPRSSATWSAPSACRSTTARC
jgi:GTP-binding protein HflX